MATKKDIPTPTFGINLNPYNDGSYRRDQLMDLLSQCRQEQAEIKNYRDPNGLHCTRYNELRPLEIKENQLALAIRDYDLHHPVSFGRLL